MTRIKLAILSNGYVQSFIDEYNAAIFYDTPFGDLHCTLDNDLREDGSLRALSFRTLRGTCKQLGIDRYIEGLSFHDLAELKQDLYFEMIMSWLQQWLFTATPDFHEAIVLEKASREESPTLEVTLANAITHCSALAGMLYLPMDMLRQKSEDAIALIGGSGSANSIDAPKASAARRHHTRSFRPHDPGRPEGHAMSKNRSVTQQGELEYQGQSVGAARHQPSFAICTALPLELAATLPMLDGQERVNPESPDDTNQYWIGSMPSRAGAQPHQVLVTSLAKMGNNVAAAAVTHLVRSFPTVEYILMVGIAGGVPKVESAAEHVRLGDVVVSNEQGVLQYDKVKRTRSGTRLRIIVRDDSPRPSSALISAAKDLLAGSFSGSYPWQRDIERGNHLAGFECPDFATDILHSSVDASTILNHPVDNRRRYQPHLPIVHHGAIASANTLLKDPLLRDHLRDTYGVKAIEMEGSGTADGSWNAGRAYIIVRGICDYCDAHKNNTWQPYAALVAAAYARALVGNIAYYPPKQ